MAVRVLARTSIVPPQALTRKGIQYFSRRTAENVNLTMGQMGQVLERRVQTRLETETFTKSKFGHAGEHTGRTAKSFQVVSRRSNTPVKGLEKGTTLSIYMGTGMPFPLITSWGGFGVHHGAPFRIRTRKDRRGSGRGGKKRLVFFWKNMGRTFWGKQVTHPGFGPDVITQELTAVQPAMREAAVGAVSRSVVEWTVGSGGKPASRTNVRR